MNKKQISFEAAFNFACSAFIANLFTFFMIWCSTCIIGLAAFLLLALSAGSMVFGFILISGPWILLTPWWALSVFSFVTALMIFYGFYHYQMVRFSLALYEGKPLSWTQFFSVDGTLFMRFCIARLMRWILILIGMILIVPAIYWACTYYFAGYSLVDSTSKEISEDRAYSSQLTKGVRWQTLGFMILIYFMSFLTALLCLFPVPILYLATLHAYKQLKQQETLEYPQA